MFRFIFLIAFLIFPRYCFSRPVPPTRSLATVQKSLNITNFVWDGDSLLLTNEFHQLRFFSGRRKAEIDGVTVWLNQEPIGTPNDGTWKIAAADLDFLNLSILPRQEEKVAEKLLVVVDPGHGGDDPGAPSAISGWDEKDFTLIMARQLGTSLTNAGFQVKYTRTNDTYRSLSQRTRFAQNEKADLFISIHANYASNKDAHGFETYVVPPSGFRGTMTGSRLCKWQQGNKNDFPNTLLAYSIQKEVITTLTNRIDRGIRRQSFYVLRNTSCPAVLIEFGFLSNLQEAKEMQSVHWQSNHVAAVTQGVITYAKKINTLDVAVAKKREDDRKANEAWRAKLKAIAAKKRQRQLEKLAASPLPVGTLQQGQKVLIDQSDPQSLAAPFPLAAFPDPVEECENKSTEENAGRMHPAPGHSLSQSLPKQQFSPPQKDTAREQRSQKQDTEPATIQADTLLKFYIKEDSNDERAPSRE